MPIHNLGYREWDGERLSGHSRWSVIAGIGIRRAWQSKWLRRIAFVVWVPPLIYGILIFVFEQVLSSPATSDLRELQGALDIFLPPEGAMALKYTLAALDEASSEQLLTVIRPIFWKSVLLQLQRSQSIGMVLVVGLIAPPLISQDVRSRAFLLYFSRPLTRFQYIAGKFATVGAFLLVTCTLPQILLYIFAVLLSPDISVVAYTWDLPLRTMVASAATIIPTTMLALMLSSLTTETRFATFGWFTIWIFGLTAWLVMWRLNNGDTSELVLRIGFLFLLFSDISTHFLGLTSNIRDLAKEFTPTDLPIPTDLIEIPSMTPYFDTQFAFAIGLTVVCAMIVFRRVSAPLQA